VDAVYPFTLMCDGQEVRRCQRYLRRHDDFMQILEDEWQRLDLTAGSHTIGIRNDHPELSIGLSRIVLQQCDHFHGQLSLPKWALVGDISPVFGQLQTGTTVDSESAAIRFAAAIDSRDFAEAGFVFSKVTANPTVDDAASLAVSTTTVWTSINAAGLVVTAEELHGSYIFACTVNGIGNANFGTDIYVRAYVKDFDGNYTYTDAKTYSVTNMLG
jgi:hypothetical protein